MPIKSQPTLSIARSNVSTSIRELLSWGIVRQVPILGERKDHFESLKDVWEMFMIVLEERKRRELDPSLTMLRTCAKELEKPEYNGSHLKHQIHAMQDFFETMSTCHEQVKTLPMDQLIQMMKQTTWLKHVLKFLR